MWQVNTELKEFNTQVSKFEGFVKVQDHTDTFIKYLENGKIEKVTFQGKGNWTTKEIDYTHDFMEWVGK